MINGSGAHTLTFTAAGLTSATSSSFTVASSAPTFQLAVNGTPTASVASGAQISIPVSLNIANGSAANGANVGALQFNVTWDPTKFTFVSGALGGSCAASTRNEGTAASGVVSINGFCSTGVTTSQALYTITLTAIGASGTSPSVGGAVTVAADDVGNPIAVSSRGVAVSITP